MRSNYLFHKQIATKEPLNPIKQDVKNNKLRFVSNSFPHHGYIWNYGALPQTWENPEHIDEATGKKGDNDPIDVIDIGTRIPRRGEIIQVKILGVIGMHFFCLDSMSRHTFSTNLTSNDNIAIHFRCRLIFLIWIGLIDEGETDWKLISINVNDPIAPHLNDFNDAEAHCPGLLKATLEWFRIYKIPDGKPENVFAFNGEIKGVEDSLKIIEQVHKFWSDLVAKKVDNSTNIICSSVQLEDSPFKISENEAVSIMGSQPAFEFNEMPEDIKGGYFVLIHN